jgi:hypothetical protein
MFDQRLNQMRAQFSGYSSSGSMRQGYDGLKGRRGHYGMERAEGTALVRVDHRWFDEHEFTILERFSPEERGLVYRHEITGPDGQSDSREIVFPIKLAPPGTCAL